MKHLLLNVAVKRIASSPRHVIYYRRFWQSNKAGYHTTQFVSSSQSNPPETLDYAADYGKYYEPTTWESIYSSFVDSGLVKMAESYLTTVHDLTGLPWWVSIVICTLSLRLTITAPLFIWQMQKNLKHKLLAPVLQQIIKQLNEEAVEAGKEHRWDKKTRDMHVFNSFHKRKKELYQKHKVPGTLRRNLVPWVQLPIWFAMTASLRNMTLSLPFTTSVSATQVQTYTELSQEGVLWFNNLCLADPYFVLPVLMAFANLATIEIHRGDGKTPLEGISKYLINFLRGISLVMIPVAIYMPSGVVFYWFISSGFGVTQALVMQSPKFKKLMRMPMPVNYSKTPYQDILSRFKFVKR
uniref:cytochrome c oxidase assembly protein COX18, mitochondrial-like n=1 Tax=Styela clava TaxID=7725 RepID=UPI00193943EF|nr:cytochrome c oxidase assembly protein COX18, mitochondrial-like [Styela clava]